MSLPQLHYAWEPSGPSGPGFRFTAVTAGVPSALLGEAEQLIAYERPRGAPERPTAEELARFPEALSLSLLSDGSRLLARSAYARTGAFHAHAVHLPGSADAGPARGALPVTAWRSPEWAARTPAGGPPPPLERIPAPGPHDRAALAEFVAARGPSLAGFFTDVRRLAEDPGAPRIALVEADSGAVAHWVMLACSVLPHRRAQWLTFTTYTRRPGRARQQLVGVLPEEADGLTGPEHGFRLYGTTPTPGPGPDPGPWARTAALVWLAGRAELFARVRRLPGEPYEAGPLAALALMSGITLDPDARTAAADWAAAHREALDAGARRGLAEELGPGLRAALTDPEQEPARLAGVAAALGVDVTGQLPEVARRLALALVSDPDGAYGPVTRDALAGLPVLRALVLDRLDALAAGDPAAGVRLFARTGLRLGAAETTPHLRMCARAAETETEQPEPDRVGTLHALLRASGVSLYAEPLVLRTAMRLVWGGNPPEAAEAGLLLAETGPDVHRESGTWELLARAVATAPAADPAAAELAPRLLRHFGTDLPDPLRPPLLLWELAWTLRPGQPTEPGTDVVRRVVELGVLAPGAGALDRAHAAVARWLLGPDRHEGALRALIESGDAELVAAYRRAAHTESVKSRLREDPRYLAERYADWSAQPQAGPVWREARTDLLNKVLAPIARTLKPQDLATIERELAAIDERRAEEFRTWRRPPLTTRLRARLTGTTTDRGRGPHT
ncbi:GTPase-associated protein 1-related protein [Streptomyces sp. NBC_00249]|uniref:GTPase-associated protein 1-related protein n=1 Tax=Streptomyces sp. NBC_00249 TaxID=2975690 RepID=UPI00225624D2|nr:GTPase-associated protein 1-related protein [Streptomyces sp. NBC_00249]MCX5193704.1 GTPase-associated protein 1-related protein [Streptomyces sp. NBC_00249]